MVFNIYSIIATALIFSVIGYMFNNFIRTFIDKSKINKYNDEINSIFSDILENITIGKTKFVNRINNTVNITTHVNDYGVVNVVYLMDRQDIAIFKNDKCIYTSDLVNKDIVKAIVMNINLLYREKIDDVVDLMGMIFSREDFEKKFNVKVADLKGIFNTKSITSEKSDIDSIVAKNKNKFNIDDILDRINSIGIDNLTLEEKKFLDNYKK